MLSLTLTLQEITSQLGRFAGAFYRERAITEELENFRAVTTIRDLEKEITLLREQRDQIQKSIEVLSQKQAQAASKAIGQGEK